MNAPARETDTLHLATPRRRPLSPAMQREATALLASLLLDAARQCRARSGLHVVPVAPPVDAPPAAPITPLLRRGDPAQARNRSKSQRSAA